MPISIIAHDPAVLRRIAGWGWQDGLRPDPHAPVWPMSAFRDRFLSAFGSSTRRERRGTSAARTSGPPSVLATAGRPGRHPRPGGAVRGGEPRLPARVPRLPGRPGAVLGRLVHLRALRGRRVHRAVRLLAGAVAGPPRLAARRGLAVRAAAGPAHPPGVLGRARLQPRGGVAGRRRRRGRERPARSRSSSTACWCRTSSARRARTGRSGRWPSRPSCTSCSRCCS